MRFALYFSLSAMLIRLALYFLNYTSEELPRQFIFLHLLFIIGAILLSILYPKKEQKKLSTSPLFKNIRNGLQGGVSYAVFISIFVAIFYKFIDPEYFYARRNALIDIQTQAAETPEQIAQVSEQIKTSFTLFNYTTVTLVGFVSASLLISILLGSAMHFMKERMR